MRYQFIEGGLVYRLFLAHTAQADPVSNAEGRFLALINRLQSGGHPSPSNRDRRVGRYRRGNAGQLAKMPIWPRDFLYSVGDCDQLHLMIGNRRLPSAPSPNGHAHRELGL